MSYGQAEKPCNMFRHWLGNAPLCGNCAWKRSEHTTFPVVNQIVFALIFDDKVVGFKRWSEQNANWEYSETYRRESVWSYDFKYAYTKIELVHIYPKIEHLKT